MNKSLRIILITFLCVVKLTLNTFWPTHLHAQEREKVDVLKLLDETLATIQNYYPLETDENDLMKAVMLGMHKKAVKLGYVQNAVSITNKTAARIAYGERFTEVLSTLQEATNFSKYELVYAGIQSMLNTLDSHSHIYPIEPRFEWIGPWPKWGIGLGICFKDGQPTVLTVLHDSPAFRVGIHPDDIIAKIDGRTTQYMGSSEIALRTIGIEGTDVRLTIMREGWNTPQTITVSRNFNLKNFHYRVIESQIGYMRLHQFYDNSPKDVDEALTYFCEHPVTAVIVDLRDNMGGHMEAVLKIAERFLRDGTILVTTISRSEEHKFHIVTQSPTPPVEYPLVLLVNQDTAGVAEVFAAALQAHSRGVVVGTVTMGNAAIRSFIPLKESHNLKLLSVLYVTPDEHVISGQGVIPDIFTFSQKSLKRLVEDDVFSDENDTPILVYDEKQDTILSVTLDIIRRSHSNNCNDFVAVARGMSERAY